MTLLQARQGKIYAITSINGEQSLRRRLLDLGFTPKTELYVSAVAPFGGTILVGIRDSMVALRDDAAQIINVHEKSKKASRV